MPHPISTTLQLTLTLHISGTYHPPLPSSRNIEPPQDAFVDSISIDRITTQVADGWDVGDGVSTRRYVEREVCNGNSTYDAFLEALVAAEHDTLADALLDAV